MFIILIALILLILACAIFRGTEVAVFALNRAELEKLADGGNARASKILKFISENDRFLNYSHIATDLCLMLGSAYAASFYSAKIVTLVSSVDGAWLEYVCIFFITVLFSFFSIALGDIVPRHAAMKNPQRFAFRNFGFVRVGFILLSPTILVVSAISFLCVKLIGEGTQESSVNMTETMIRQILDNETEEENSDNLDQHKMIRKIFEFDDISIAELCTHRRDVDFLCRDDDIDKWNETINGTRHNYYPICGDNNDNVISVLNVRKYLSDNFTDTSEAIKQAGSEPFFVPENMKADVLFNKMKEKRTYFAVVIDEYGGTRGVITMIDLVETLVGDMHDEEVQKEEEITQLEEGKWQILGSASLDEVNEALEMYIEDEDHDTFGGYIVGVYGSIPADGSVLQFETNDLIINILSVTDHRIEKTEVIKRVQIH